MSVKISFNELPTSSIEVQEGIYTIEIKDVVLTKTKNGLDAFVFQHQLVGMSNKINDYVMVNNADGSAHNFGRRKLRSLIEASKVEILDITPATLKQLLVGKQIKAEIVINDRGYPEISYDNFYTLDSAHETVNATTSTPGTPATDVTASPEVVKELTPADFEDDDI
jgi:hypothetical protein